MKAVVSNGFSKFHLAPAAANLAQDGLLESFITGAYPNECLQSLLQRWPIRKNCKLARLLARKEDIPSALTHALWLPEMFYASRVLFRNGGEPYSYYEWLNRYSFKLY